MNYDSLITMDPYGTRNACKPWNSADAKNQAVSVHTCDSQAQIEACLHCTLPECVPGCVPLKRTPWQARPRHTPRGKPSRLDKDGIGRRLFSQGLMDKEVAAILGLTKNSVYAWRKKNGIVATRKNKGGNVCSAS